MPRSPCDGNHALLLAAPHEDWLWQMGDWIWTKRYTLCACDKRVVRGCTAGSGASGSPHGACAVEETFEKETRKGVFFALFFQ